MNIIFYEVTPNTNKLAFTVSEDAVNELKKSGVIPQKSITLTKEYSTFASTLEGKAILAHVDKARFDNAKNPNKIVLDVELVSMFILDIYREARKDVFAVLDSLQMRAIVKKRDDVVLEIEADKDLLRSLPETLKLTNAKTINDIITLIPRELGVDYAEKYGYRLK